MVEKRNCKAFQDFRKTVTKTCALFSVARSHKPTGRAHGGARGGSWSLVGNFGGHDGAGTVFTQNSISIKTEDCKDCIRN